MKTKTQTKKTVEKPTLVAFLLDRSGSMSSHLQETINGFNSYVKTMKKNDKADGGKGRFTLTQFDSEAVDIVQDFVKANNAEELTMETYRPRSYTPLYDAMGKTIRAMETKAKDFNVLFVVQTDGLENASTEWDSSKIRDLIKTKETDDKWTFAYLGMGPSGWSQARDMARGTAGATNVMNYAGSVSAKAYATMGKADKFFRSSKGAGGQSVNCSTQSIFQGDEDQTK